LSQSPFGFVRFGELSTDSFKCRDPVRVVGRACRSPSATACLKLRYSLAKCQVTYAASERPQIFESMRFPLAFILDSARSGRLADPLQTQQPAGLLVLVHRLRPFACNSIEGSTPDPSTVREPSQQRQISRRRAAL